jgi:U3 small nucleolar RNA-associated protein 13
MKDDGVECVGVGLRHNNSIGDVALSQLSSSFMLSGAQDTTLKLWDLPKSFKSGVHLLSIINVLNSFSHIHNHYVLFNLGESLNVRQTKIAHEKDINGVCVSPNDQIIATASLDKTAKVS